MNKLTVIDPSLTSKEKASIQNWLLAYLKDQGIQSPDLDSGDLQKLYYPWAELKEAAWKILEENIRPIFVKYVSDMKEDHVLENLLKYSTGNGLQSQLQNILYMIEEYQNKLSQAEDGSDKEHDAYNFLKGRKQQLKDFWKMRRETLQEFMVRERVEAMFNAHHALMVAYDTGLGGTGLKESWTGLYKPEILEKIDQGFSHLTGLVHNINDVSFEIEKKLTPGASQ